MLAVLISTAVASPTPLVEPTLQVQPETNTALATVDGYSFVCNATGCPWDPLEVQCKAGLSVSFNIYHYRGLVNCGNLFLAPDLGALATDPTPFAPNVQWPAADSSKHYTLLMLDPDAALPGSWPFSAIGTLEPIRHMLVGNIAGDELTAGITAADIAKAPYLLSPYQAPAPPSGSHRYGFFIFEQSEAKIAFKPLNNTDDTDTAGANGQRFSWDLPAFLTEYNLGSPVASNWMVVLTSPQGYTPVP